ncbi:hypothetical protein dqs_0707 [Azoarcus olearius]|uniref:(Fe-S)-binding protein n=1 Tax=Azoarcus sp. (strain BH72) TaxID=418699 RepID=UPI0008061C06|nr:4Fe-4S dicluster domain-containing protein [Azoarcus olearius]ANQ83782.1 hypothetical protein dqs_0707 [Azoarcus olearius]
METKLDWSAYDNTGMGDPFGADPFGAGSFGGDAFGAAAAPVAGGAFGKAVALCTGNRACLRTDSPGVMCPSFRATEDPLHSTRGRIEALNAALAGADDAVDFSDPRLAEAMALCLSCKGCKRECPNGVDMALLRAEYLAQRNAREGVPAQARLLASFTDHLAAYPALRWLVALRNRVAPLAALGERWWGIARERRLPAPASRPFKDASPASVPAEGPQVALLVDSFCRHFEPGVAEAALAVLRAAGYRVTVLAPAADDANPTRPLCCGRSKLSFGLVDDARAEARRMMAALAPALAARIPVVGLEPSCLFMLKDEYFSLGLGPDVGRLAGQVFLFEEFLAREHAAGRLRLALKPLVLPPALVHGHCHQKAYGAMPAVSTVLGLIPGFSFGMIDSGCCGMAGSFGLQARNQAVSRKLAEAALLPAVRAAEPEAPVVADGFSCRHQIRDGAGRRPVHVAELLQRALA